MELETTRNSFLLRLRDRTNDSVWSEFDRRYRDLIFGYCRSRGIQPADADDIRQSVMASLSSAIVGFAYDRSKGRFRDYLGRIATNAVRRHLGQRAQHGPRLDTEAQKQLPDGSADELDERWHREWMRHHYCVALRRLRRQYDPRSLAVFEVLLGGESVTDAATRFGTTEQAVHKIKQRVRNRLREHVAEQISAEDRFL